MNQYVGTRITFTDRGETITGTIIMIFKYDTIDCWGSSNVRYVVVSGKKYYTTTNGKSAQSFTKFSAVKSLGIGHGPYSTHSYGNLSKGYNMREGSDINNIKWFIENGHRSNRLRNGFDDALKLHIRSRS